MSASMIENPGAKSTAKSQRTESTALDSSNAIQDCKLRGAHDTGSDRKEPSKKPNAFKKFVANSSKTCTNKLLRWSSTASQLPDILTEEEKSQLRDGRRIREALEQDAEYKFKMGVVYFESEDYCTAKQNFHKALRARLMMLGADHPDLVEVHEALSFVAMLEGDMNKASHHLNAVERLKALEPET